MKKFERINYYIEWECFPIRARALMFCGGAVQTFHYSTSVCSKPIIPFLDDFVRGKILF